MAGKELLISRPSEKRNLTQNIRSRTDRTLKLDFPSFPSPRPRFQPPLHAFCSTKQVFSSSRHLSRSLTITRPRPSLSSPTGLFFHVEGNVHIVGVCKRRTGTVKGDVGPCGVKDVEGH